MEYVVLSVPVIFLVASVIIAIKAVQNGSSKQKAFARQLFSFCVVAVCCLATPIVANAASDTGAVEQAAQTASNGMQYLAAAIVTGLSGIGGGIAVASAAPAAIGATSEDPKAFGKALIFVALGEGIALYGLLVSILILFI